ncbi:hypothetical protein ACFLY9_02405 [Patescibacteria group bacterium]
MTERIEGLNENTVISGFDEKVINNFVKNYSKYKRPFKKTKIKPSEKIVNWLKRNNYGE